METKEDLLKYIFQRKRTIKRLYKKSLNSLEKVALSVAKHKIGDVIKTYDGRGKIHSIETHIDKKTIYIEYNCYRMKKDNTPGKLQTFKYEVYNIKDHI